MLYFTIACLLRLIALVDGAAIPALCIQERTCFLPTCRCQNSGIPDHFSPNEIPQMVILTFEGALTEAVYHNFKALFKGKKNPNGYPISGTLYVSSNDTVFGRVHDLYDTGLEIGLFSSGKTDRSWATKLLTRREFSILAGIPLQEIRGYREADPHPSEPSAKERQILSQNGFEYGSSNAYDISKGQPDNLDSFPYTDVSKMNTLCTGENCQTPSHLWQMDFIRNDKFSVLPDHNPCREDIFMSGELRNYLFRTFTQHYRNGRSPMVLNLPTLSLASLPLLITLDNFLQTMTSFRDTYVVSVHQAIQWTKHPHTTHDILNFAPWKRSFRLTNHLLNTTAHKSDSEKIDADSKASPWKMLQNQLLDHVVESVIISRRDNVLELYESETLRKPQRMLIFTIIGALVLLFIILAFLVFLIQKLSARKEQFLPSKVTHDAMYEFYGGSPV